MRALGFGLVVLLVTVGGVTSAQADQIVPPIVESTDLTQLSLDGSGNFTAKGSSIMMNLQLPGLVDDTVINGTFDLEAQLSGGSLTGGTFTVSGDVQDSGTMATISSGAIFSSSTINSLTFDPVSNDFEFKATENGSTPYANAGASIFGVIIWHGAALTNPLSTPFSETNVAGAIDGKAGVVAPVPGTLVGGAALLALCSLIAACKAARFGDVAQH